MGAVTITFLGGTETVTGSRFIVSSPSATVLVECGMFQGLHEIEKRNWDEFKVKPEDIDAIILSHAHLDHCGYIPLLVKHGYKNPIFGTFYTEKLAGVILHDSARLQMHEAEYRKESLSSKMPALYNTIDVEKALSLFRSKAFHEKVSVAKNTFVTFYPSGHILGSAFLVLEMEESRILFTGDMGRDNHPLLVPPETPGERSFDAVVTESTYGDRRHETPVSAFAHEINKAISRGGSILIPAFAVDRTEVILMALRELIENGGIPLTPIYVDSPMALAALNYYRQAIADGAPEIRDSVREKFAGVDPFDPGNLREMYSAEDSKKIDALERSSIVVSASGMATGGRVLHHLANMLPDSENTVILVGYQSAGTRGQALLRGDEKIKIHGKWVEVRAHIASVEAFSVHADVDELVNWLKKIGTVEKALIVHGETDSQLALKSRLENEFSWLVKIPKTDQIISI
ncbi:unannotated protein [freshwater metagenome]|uniref:Unannotated protein n=1 Tax=freshwater metagenome TaxID=449393 RepID=A0A6J7XTX4_9ZZZZ|nr:MBL fold metallo-hydrolase [Actinomycetota bacterium]